MLLCDLRRIELTWSLVVVDFLFGEDEEEQAGCEGQPLQGATLGESRSSTMTTSSLLWPGEQDILASFQSCLFQGHACYLSLWSLW